MNTAEQPRESSVIREEITDLAAYLNNLPSAVRSSGAFKSYELRIAQLRDELITRLLLDLSSFGSSKQELMQGQIEIPEIENKFPFFKRLINERKKFHNNMASKFERRSDLLQHFTFCASITALASVASTSSLSLMPVVGTVVLAGLHLVLGFTPKLRLEHKLAEDLEWMESEITKLENKEQTEQDKKILIEHLSERAEVLVRRYESTPLVNEPNANK